MNNDQQVLEQVTILDDAIRKSIDAASLEIHTALPARVTAIDLDNQLITIELGVKRIYVDGTERIVQPIEQVPLGVLRGGNWCITLPVAVGDQGLAIFSEREMTQWMLAGDQGAQTPRQIRKHSYTDAYFLPALASSAKKLAAYNPTALEIRSIDGMVKQIFNTTAIVWQLAGVTMTLNSAGLTVQNGIISTNMDVLAGADEISLVNHTHTSGAEGSPTSPPLPG